MQLSTDKILDRVTALALEVAGARPVEHLDIGSGTGALVNQLQSVLRARSRCCDYTSELMQVPGQKVDVANLNYDALPYDNASFDLVTCTEVVEHLENHRRLIRETWRVLKPGGCAIFTTPNVLSIKSRLSYFTFGFPNLFGPLPVNRTEAFSTVGHITPISYFYLAHALMEAGYGEPRLEVDKMQRSAILRLVLWYPFIWFFGRMMLRRERLKYRTVDASNEKVVAQINSPRLLLGRTIIVLVRKP